MKFLIIILFLFKFFSPLQANTIYYLTKIPNLAVHDLTALNGVKYLKAKKSFKVGIVQNNVQCNAANENNIKKKIKTIKKNFDKYDKDFLEKINVRYVVFCENLRVSDINTAGVPNHNVKTLIIDIQSDEKYFERSIHHELFHMIDDSYEKLFSYDNWKKLNNPNFEYAKCSTCSNRLDLSLIENTKGFLTEYSMSTPSEDMAEIFSFLSTNNNKLTNIISKDPVLDKKIKFLKNEILKIDKNFKF